MWQVALTTLLVVKEGVTERTVHRMRSVASASNFCLLPTCRSGIGSGYGPGLPVKQVIWSLLISTGMLGYKITSLNAIVRTINRKRELETIIRQLTVARMARGARVYHQQRGYGRITEVVKADPRDKPYHVTFDNGERHCYSLKSAAKFILVPSGSVRHADLMTCMRRASYSGPAGMVMEMVCPFSNPSRAHGHLRE